MSKISLYISKNIILSTLLVLITLSSLLMVLQLFKFIHLVLSQGLPVSSLLYISLITLPTLWVDILPFAILLGSIFVWYSMIVNQELAVLKTSGCSNIELVKPILYIGIFFSLLSLMLSWYTIPKSYDQYFQFRKEIKSSFNTKLIEPGAFITLSPEITFYTREIFDNQFIEIIMLIKSQKKDIFRLIYASQGYTTTYNGQLTLLLENTTIYESNIDNQSALYLDKYALQLTPSSESPNIRNSARELYIHEMIAYNSIAQRLGFQPKTDEYLEFKHEVFNDAYKRISLVILPTLIATLLAFLLTKLDISRNHNNQRAIANIVIYAITIKIAAIGLIKNEPPLLLLFITIILIPLLAIFYMLNRISKS